jgi:hypothetical protein
MNATNSSSSLVIDDRGISNEVCSFSLGKYYLNTKCTFSWLVLRINR